MKLIEICFDSICGNDPYVYLIVLGKAFPIAIGKRISDEGKTKIWFGLVRVSVHVVILQRKYSFWKDMPDILWKVRKLLYGGWNNRSEVNHKEPWKDMALKTIKYYSVSPKVFYMNHRHNNLSQPARLLTLNQYRFYKLYTWVVNDLLNISLERVIAYPEYNIYYYLPKHVYSDFRIGK